jgi:hypothetical protein
METYSPAAYLEAALRIIGERALYVRTLDWEAIAEEARKQASHASDTAGTYPAIRSALLALGDGHSFLMTPSQVERWRGDVQESWAVPRLELNGRVAHVPLGAFDSANGDACLRYATQLQQEIASVYHEAIGWIVDLRPTPEGTCGQCSAGLARFSAMVSTTPSSWPMEAGCPGAIGRDERTSVMWTSSR